MKWGIVNYKDLISGIRITFEIHSVCNKKLKRNVVSKVIRGSIMTRRSAFWGMCKGCKYVMNTIWDAKYEL